MLCPECSQELSDTAKFCSECGARLTPAGAPVREALPVETRRMVTVLFVDVTGSTPLGERLDPEAVRRIFSRYFGEVAAIVARHGGTLEKFAGDALVAVFGLPVLHEDDALRAVRTAVEARAALAVINDELVRDYGLGLNTRTGINTGEVVGAGANSTGSTLATGDMVNVAARLEARAQPGEIVIGAATHRLVRDAITAEELPPLELKGKSEPVAAFRLVDVAPDAPGLLRRFESPIVGRSFELAELLESFDAAVEQRACRVATLLGDAGAGKSRLSHELAAVVGERAWRLEGRCVPYGEGITYFPLAIMLKPLAGIEDDDNREQARGKLLALLAGVEDGSLIVTRLGGAIGLDDVLARPEEIAWAVRRLLETLSLTRPLLVFFDDLHWAEPTFLRLIQYLGEHARDAPMLVVCSSRPDLSEKFPPLFELPGAVSIALESLPQQATGSLVANLLGDDVADEVVARVEEVAEGNPLFIEETVRMLLDEGLIVRQGNRWEPVRDLAEVVLPPSIEALLAARLDRLEPAELQVLQRASVIGRIFGWGAVRELTPEPARDGLATALQGLLKKEVVFTDAQLLSGEDAYRFGHILVRDAAYRGVPKETRAELHERFATFLADTTGDRVGEYEEIIGYHLEQAFGFRMELGPLNEVAADLRARGRARLDSAGERALYRGDLPAALNLFQRAAALTEGVADHAELQIRVSGVLMQLGQLAEAEALLEVARDMARDEGHERWAGHAELGLELVLLQTDPADRTAEIIALTDRLVPYFTSTGDDLGLARAWRLRSKIARLVCRFAEEAAALELAISHAEAAGDERYATENRLWLGSSLCYGPTPVSAAIARASEMLERARGVRWVEASIYGMLGYLHAMADAPDLARDYHDRSGVILEELGMAFPLAARTVNSARIEVMAGDLDAAERQLRWGYEQLERVGETEVRSTAAAVLAQVLYDQGRDDEAEEFALTSQELAAADDVYSQLLWRSALGKVRARRDGDVKARSLAEEAVRLAAATDSFSFHGWALLDLARVDALLSGDAPPAELVAEATALFRRKEDAVSLRRAALQFAEAGVSAVRT